MSRKKQGKNNEILSLENDKTEVSLLLNSDKRSARDNIKEENITGCSLQFVEKALRAISEFLTPDFVNTVLAIKFCKDNLFLNAYVIDSR